MSEAEEKNNKRLGEEEYIPTASFAGSEAGLGVFNLQLTVDDLELAVEI